MYWWWINYFAYFLKYLNVVNSGAPNSTLQKDLWQIFWHLFKKEGLRWKKVFSQKQLLDNLFGTYLKKRVWDENTFSAKNNCWTIYFRTEARDAQFWRNFINFNLWPKTFILWKVKLNVQPRKWFCYDQKSWFPFSATKQPFEVE